MINPQHSLQILRPETQASQNLPEEELEQTPAPIIAHDEPETPISTDLEYEVLYAGEDSSTEYVAPPLLPVARRKRSVKNDIKLLVSFLFLVIVG